MPFDLQELPQALQVSVSLPIYLRNISMVLTMSLRVFNFLIWFRIKYYNGCLFHTVQKDFTAQTGDPTGTGAGGDSIYK